MEQSFAYIPEQKNHQVISPSQIIAIRILTCNQQQLCQKIGEEMNDNPALEGDADELCTICHHSLNECGCSSNSSASLHDADGGEIFNDGRSDDWDLSMHSVRSAGSFDENDEDPINRIGGRDEYCAGLLVSLHATIHSEDTAIADYLVGNLNDKGLLPVTIVADTANIMGVAIERVESVLYSLQQLEPSGIGARTAKESLLLQLARLRAENYPRDLTLAETIIRDHFEALAARHYREISRKLPDKTPRMIEIEHQFIRNTLHPHPAHGFDPDLSGMVTGAIPIRPDVVIRRSSVGLVADVIERRRWHGLKISPTYLSVQKMLKEDSMTCSTEEQKHIKESTDNAKNLLAALDQRWKTMQKVANSLINLQRDYIDNGPSGLIPLTRKDVGEVIGMHESTVSRATAGKFVLLPNGETVPFDNFFNDSLSVRIAIEHLVETEDLRHPYSDEQLTAALKSQGLDVARRTVAKYREEMRILPSRLRRNRVDPQQKQYAPVTSPKNPPFHA